MYIAKLRRLQREMQNIKKWKESTDKESRTKFKELESKFAEQDFILDLTAIYFV